METPCRCTSDVHYYGGGKIVSTSGTYVGYLGEWLSVLNKQAFTY